MGVGFGVAGLGVGFWVWGSGFRKGWGFGLLRLLELTCAFPCGASRTRSSYMMGLLGTLLHEEYTIIEVRTGHGLFQGMSFRHLEVDRPPVGGLGGGGGKENTRMPTKFGVQAKGLRAYGFLETQSPIP